MENRKGSLIKNIFIFGLGTSLSKVMSVLLVGLYTKYILPQDYGSADILTTTVMALTPLITLQIIDALYRHLLDANEERDIQRTVTCAFFVIIIGLAASPLLALVVDAQADLHLGWVLPLYMMTTILFSFSQSTARGLRRNSVYAVSGIAYTGVMLAANIILIAVLGLGAEALFYSIIIADVFGILFIEIAIGVYRRVRFSLFSGVFLKNMCRYSIPLLPGAVTWWMLALTNRYSIRFFIGEGANGLFAAASKFPALLMTVYGIFALAWQENAISEFESHDRNEYYTRTFRRYSRLLYGALLLLLPLTRHLVGFLIDAKYYDCWRYIPFLYLGSMFQAFANFYAAGYMGAKKTMGAFITTLLGVGCGIALCLAAMPIIGIQAASLAHMTAFLLMWLSRIFHTRRYFRIRLEGVLLPALTFLTGLYIYLGTLENAVLDVVLLTVAAPLFLFLNKELILLMWRALIARLRAGKASL